MKISYDWLKELVDINKPAIEVAEDLNLKSTAVEEVVQNLDDNIIVGEVIEIKPHPNADRLSVLVVDNGTKKIQLVCGAKNFKVGDKVPLASIGAKIGDMCIAEAEIRGVRSYGMLCSEHELSISNDHSGIKILPDTYIAGKKLNEYIESDTLLDIEITPNRGDLLSHIGISREISAIYNKELKYPIIDDIEYRSTNLSIDIENSDLCPQYYAIKIKNVNILPSPKWLKDRLTFLGINPVNNIVDITNYVMLELGQPIHAFDADKIADNKIIVRKTGEMEKTVTLDGVTRNLPNESLVISDKEKILAVAGIMGGKNSEIKNSTKNIILEAAEFDRISVRKTSKKIGLATDASYRFERGIDSDKIEFTIKRAVNLINKLAGGVAEKIVGSKKIVNHDSIEINYQGINSLLGTALNESEINDTLTKLGFCINKGHAQPPSFRHDISIWQDLAEEVGRINGYDKIKQCEVKTTKPYKRSTYFIKERIKDELTNLGFTEVYNYNYLSEKDVEVAGLSNKNLLEIANPLQKENKYLRSSLVPCLLKNIAKNPSFDPILLFEFGNTFTINNEHNYLGLVSSGKNAKKTLENAINKISKFFGNDKKNIPIKELNKNELHYYKIKKPNAYVAEMPSKIFFDNHKLTDKELNLKLSEINASYRSLSQYPPISRDLAFIVNSNIDSNSIANEIKNICDLVIIVELFDEFASDKFGKNKKNIAFHVYLQNIKKSMTDDEANTVIAEIIKKIENKFSAKLRS
jgi:phenylalanyl-tRNA synthetase beta chain